MPTEFLVQWAAAHGAIFTLVILRRVIGRVIGE